MDVMKITHNEQEFLFNGRAYISINTSEEKLSELEKELETINKKYTVLFQQEALYNFHKKRGLPDDTISILAELKVGHARLLNTDKHTARVGKLSNSFYYIEWIQ